MLSIFGREEKVEGPDEYQNAEEIVTLASERLLQLSLGPINSTVQVALIATSVEGDALCCCHYHNSLHSSAWAIRIIKDRRIKRSNAWFNIGSLYRHVIEDV